MKKGFTLVEVLAVISLMMIIISITYTVFNKQRQTVKQSLYDEQVAIIEQAGKDYNLSNLSAKGVMISKLISEGLIGSSTIISPLDKSTMTGCVIFEENSYNQTEYVYEDDIEACLINAYSSYNVFINQDTVLLTDLISEGYITEEDITANGSVMTGCIMLISGEATYESNVSNCN